MADNISTSSGTLATDDIGGVQYPRSKVGFGADGAYTDVSLAAPLPVTDAGGGPATRWASVTPSDTTDLGTSSANAPRAIYVGGAGNLVVRGSDGNVVTFAVPSGGVVLPLRAYRVMAATTATGIVALY